MIASFEFATSGTIVFGCGKIRELHDLIDAKSDSVLLVSGVPAMIASAVKTHLRDLESVWELPVHNEPSVESILEGVEVCRSHSCTKVIGIGGGSAIDTAKAISVLLTNPGNPLDYLEVVGSNKPLALPGIPCFAIPTTSGTGAEVTRNAVISVSSKRVKVSLRSKFLLPSLALIDPELTLPLPPGITASSGMDALTQVLEPFVSPRANPISDCFCQDGLQLAASALQGAFHYGENIEYRQKMALASLYGGLALANSGLGAVHGVAGPLGGMTDLPHGLLCARLLPYVVEINIRALRGRNPGSIALARYKRISEILTSNQDASLEDGIAWLKDLIAELEIPSFSQLKIDRALIPAVVEKAVHASSMKANPILLTSEEIEEIVEVAM